MSRMGLINHIESNLGSIEGSWKLNDEAIGVQVISFNHQPFEDLTTFTTLGLSDTSLSLGASKTIRQEFVFTVKSGLFENERIASFLLTFSNHIINRGKGLLRGELIGPGERIFLGANCQSIYSSIPVFFGDDFEIFQNTDHAIVFVWLLPLLDKDAAFVKQKGWNAFEDILEGTENVEVFWTPNISFT